MRFIIPRLTSKQFGFDYPELCGGGVGYIKVSRLLNECQSLRTVIFELVMDWVNQGRQARRFIDAAGRLVRHGEYNPNLVMYPEDHVGELGILGGTLGIAAQGVSTVAQHAITQYTGGPAQNTRSKQTKITDFGTNKRKRSDSNLRGNTKMSRPSRHIETTEAAAAAGDPMNTSAPEAASGPTATANSKTHETQVTPIPRNIKPGLPEYFTTKLVYTDLRALDIDRTTDNNGADLQVRLNSIYDVLDSVTGQQQPRWRTYFSTIYDYYTVIGTEVHITGIMRRNNSGISRGIDAPVRMLWRTYGADTPSTLAVDAETLLQDLNYKHHTYLPIGDNEDVGFRLPTMYFTHKDYMDKIEEIKQDDKEEIWTPVGASPGLNHRLIVSPRTMFDLGETAMVNNKIQVTYQLKFVYTVQFKESKIGYKFQGQA